MTNLIILFLHILVVFDVMRYIIIFLSNLSKLSKFYDTQQILTFKADILTMERWFCVMSSKSSYSNELKTIIQRIFFGEGRGGKE